MYNWGRYEAAAGEPLYEWDDDPGYVKGWCDYHGCENPYQPEQTTPTR